MSYTKACASLCHLRMCHLRLPFAVCRFSVSCYLASSPLSPSSGWLMQIHLCRHTHPCTFPIFNRVSPASFDTRRETNEKARWNRSLKSTSATACRSAETPTPRRVTMTSATTTPPCRNAGKISATVAAAISASRCVQRDQHHTTCSVCSMQSFNFPRTKACFV